ncbi:MAG: hypothetical protein AAFO07_00035 [Bacteroidota bacterium]
MSCNIGLINIVTMLNRSLFYHLLVFSVSTFVFSACSNSQPTEGQWAGTNEISLDGENIMFRFPSKFKRSSLYLLDSDIPSPTKNKTNLSLLRTFLAQTEHDDQYLDIFIDTTTQFRVLIVINAKLTDLDETQATYITQNLNVVHSRVERANSGLNIKRLESNLKENRNQKVFKLKHEITMKSNPKLYKNLYYASTDLLTIQVLEFSDIDEDVEKYMWSLRI